MQLFLFPFTVLFQEIVGLETEREFPFTNVFHVSLFFELAKYFHVIIASKFQQNSFNFFSSLYLKKRVNNKFLSLIAKKLLFNYGNSIDPTLILPINITKNNLNKFPPLFPSFSYLRISRFLSFPFLPSLPFLPFFPFPCFLLSSPLSPFSSLSSFSPLCPLPPLSPLCPLFPLPPQLDNLQDPPPQKILPH